MSADFQIHILENCTKNDVVMFHDSDYDENLYDIIGSTPGVWIGEVSWLKAFLLGNNNTYVPTTILKINELINDNKLKNKLDCELLELTDELIGQIISCFDVANTTDYKLADVNDVKEFLNIHKGKQIFTVSW